MSMDISVSFLRNSDTQEHVDKVMVLRSCLKAGVSLPSEINDYFGETDDEDYPLETEFIPRKINKEGCNMFEVDVDAIPEDVKIVRFSASW